MPTNVRVVQKSNTDTTGRIYGNIQSAIDSITNASATNRYLVKVMPGVYDLGTASLQMKDYVDVEGSGAENTVITSSNNNVDGYTCNVGTVLMANNSAIRNIKVVNMPVAQAGSFNAVAAVVFNNVQAKAEGISILVGSDTVDGGSSMGICVYNASANASLNNVSIETHNNDGGASKGINLYKGGSVTLTNSKVATFDTGDYITIIGNTTMGILTGSITVRNSILEATTPGVMTGIFAENDKIVIMDSTITLNGSPNATAVYAHPATEFSMVNSKISSDNTVTYDVDPSKVKIATSLLPGDKTGLGSAKLVNCYDQNYNSITNQ